MPRRNESDRPRRSGASSGRVKRASGVKRTTGTSGKRDVRSSPKSAARSVRSSGESGSSTFRGSRTAGKGEGKPPRSFSTGKSSKSFSTDKSSRSFRDDKSSKPFTTGKSSRPFSTGKSSKPFTTGKSSKPFSTGKSSKPFTTGKSSRSFTAGRSKPPSDSPESRETRFSRPSTRKRGVSREEGPSGGRGASFGKPFKKTYKPKASYGTGRQTKAELAATVPVSDKIRLNKFIANSGVASRREADELITMGLISVNGKVVTELGHKVNPGDEVRYEDRVLRREKPVYILMNKPKGFITTTDDPHERKTVMHIIGNTVKERIYPVGRLDRNTTGLLLLTNDGDLADKLMHPSFNVRKVYKVELDRALTKADFKEIMDGVRLEEGRAQVDDLAIVSDDGKTVGIELHIGWNRVVRRIFEHLGYEVVKLDRTMYAGLDKKELGRGQWRFLTKQEIIQLKHFK